MAIRYTMNLKDDYLPGGSFHMEGFDFKQTLEKILKNEGMKGSVDIDREGKRYGIVVETPISKMTLLAFKPYFDLIGKGIFSVDDIVAEGDGIFIPDDTNLKKIIEYGNQLRKIETFGEYVALQKDAPNVPYSGDITLLVNQGKVPTIYLTEDTYGIAYSAGDITKIIREGMGIRLLFKDGCSAKIISSESDFLETIEKVINGYIAATSENTESQKTYEVRLFDLTPDRLKKVPISKELFSDADLWFGKENPRDIINIAVHPKNSSIYYLPKEKYVGVIDKILEVIGGEYSVDDETGVIAINKITPEDLANISFKLNGDAEDILDVVYKGVVEEGVINLLKNPKIFVDEHFVSLTDERTGRNLTYEEVRGLVKEEVIEVEEDDLMP